MSDKPFDDLPEAVVRMLRSAAFTEFGTMTGAGVPLDTPLFCFTDHDGASIDVATGLAYPTKAERARRNPKVGLFIEGGPGEPVVCIAARAAVRDRDPQANLERYLAETIAYLSSYAGQTPWPIVREAIWYWVRTFIQAHPVRILWWPDAGALGGPPGCWDAPAGTVFPQSDPAPPAPPTAAPAWKTRDWRERAREILALGLPGHVTLVDDEGYPIPFRCESATGCDAGFDLSIAAGAPWRIAGKASLCFQGQATFVGDVSPIAGGARLHVQRILPDLPTVIDTSELWAPSPATREGLMGRLARELERRGLPLPVVPVDPPAPTRGGIARAQALAARYGAAAAT
ncbi:MAG: hemerythrin HHE cation-binding protein [Gammaproteobacteria bacterium]